MLKKLLISYKQQVKMLMQEQKLSRVDISRTIGETGLCFAIEKEFVEQLNGKVYAKIDKSNLKIILKF